MGGGKTAPAPVAAAPVSTPAAEPDPIVDDKRSIRRNQGSVTDNLLSGYSPLGDPAKDDPNTRRATLLGGTSNGGLR